MNEIEQTISINQVRRVSGYNLPFDAKRMFIRRYNQQIKSHGDENKAKRSGIALVRTKYKKAGSKWILKRDEK